MSLKERAIWDSRWGALAQAIEETLGYTPPSDQVDRHETIVSLLRALRDFGDKQYNFFRNGFTAVPPWLTASAAFTAEYAVRQTLDQIAFDLAAIERARNQRIHSLTSAAARATLIKADILAYESLRLAIEARIIENTSVLTYFQKAPSVRVIPYANVALVGIPYTCLGTPNNARDFLAIPHEVGHYVYWHGRKGGTSINAALRSHFNKPSTPSLPAWSLRWLEEIFADVYGCLVAGPVIAYDFQELMLDNVHFTEDDGDHPLAAIRPTIYARVLSAIKPGGVDLFKEAPAKLNNNWAAWLQERDASGKIKPKGEQEPVLLGTANNHMETIILAVKELLALADEKVAVDIWTKDDFDIADPYGGFRDNKLANLPPNTANNVPELVAEDAAQAESIIQTNPVTATPDGVGPVTFKSGETRAIWFNVLKAVENSGVSLPPEVWSIVFTNGGWAAGGPEGQGDPK